MFENNVDKIIQSDQKARLFDIVYQVTDTPCHLQKESKTGNL